MIKVILGLGSNTKYEEMQPVELLAAGCISLSELLCGMQVSSVYESKAMYVTDQENFYNMAVKGFVPEGTDPFEFLNKINRIEAKYGRDRGKEIRFGPRPLDIDIEEFGDFSINTERLQIPHPRMKEREFVLIPVLEILKESADCKLAEKLNFYKKSIEPQGVEKCPENVQVLFKNLYEGGIYGNKNC